MIIQVRVNGALAQELGTVRLNVTFDEHPTVDDLLTVLCRQYPAAQAKFKQAVPIVAGQHLPKTTMLSDGQEVALLLPIAGG